MLLCPRCRVRVEGRTCKRCGAFVKADGPGAEDPALVEGEPIGAASAIAEAPPLGLPEAAEPPPPGAWRCPGCSEWIEPNFHACWKCGSENPASEGVPLKGEGGEDEGEEPEPHRAPTCERCGSTHVIPNQIVEDRGEGSGGELQTVVYGRPEALFFRDGLHGRLLADICGNCGHVQLRVENPEALYQHYVRSLSPEKKD